MKMYRAMKADTDGLPEVGDTFGKLGVRPTIPGRKGDVPSTSSTDIVGPGLGGLSVAADSPDILPRHLVPPRGRHPLWEIDTADLGSDLKATAAGAPHYHVEAAREMTLSELQALLASTRSKWVRVS